MSLDHNKLPAIYRLQNNQLSITIPESFQAEFKELCQRAGNLWPDASPEVKTFIDLITEGKVQQDYSYIVTGTRSYPRIESVSINKPTSGESK
jgi:hypothetical protein